MDDLKAAIRASLDLTPPPEADPEDRADPVEVE